mmetsp:Transcript_10769/g.40422  ORF Transcript_10769/g.40422 Transcript_10769/m.40422 type:complete len:365 (-) Transcript_10769:4789-5883(-)
MAPTAMTASNATRDTSAPQRRSRGSRAVRPLCSAPPGARSRLLSSAAIIPRPSLCLETSAPASCPVRPAISASPGSVLPAATIPSLPRTPAAAARTARFVPRASSWKRNAPPSSIASVRIVNRVPSPMLRIRDTASRAQPASSAIAAPRNRLRVEGRRSIARRTRPRPCPCPLDRTASEETRASRRRSRSYVNRASTAAEACAFRATRERSRTIPARSPARSAAPASPGALWSRTAPACRPGPVRIARRGRIAMRLTGSTARPVRKGSSVPRPRLAPCPAVASVCTAPRDRQSRRTCEPRTTRPRRLRLPGRGPGSNRVSKASSALADSARSARRGPSRASSRPRAMIAPCVLPGDSRWQTALA